MLPKLLPLIPEHSVYVEPFCGGASLLFGKPKVNIEVINDLNKDLITLYRVAKTPQLREELIERLNATLYSRAEHEKAVNIYKQGGFDEVTTAWAFYVNSQMGFANQPNRGWGVSVVSNQALRWTNRLTRLKAQVDRLKEVYIEHKDALAIIKQWDSPSTLFYCDPPYVGTDQSHYKGYKAADLKALCDVLEKIQGSFILSGYAHDCVPASWEHFEFNATCSAANTKLKLDRARVEHVWRNRTIQSQKQLVFLGLQG